MNLIEINNRVDYDLCVSRGFEPLMDWRKFKMDIGLRLDIQAETFGKAISITKANDKFYHWNWEKKPHVCEETCGEIEVYSASVISHILSRSNRPDMAHDPRNTNILTRYYHHKWEDERRRKGMRIFPVNKVVIDLLNKDYRL